MMRRSYIWFLLSIFAVGTVYSQVARDIKDYPTSQYSKKNPIGITDREKADPLEELLSRLRGYPPPLSETEMTSGGGRLFRPSVTDEMSLAWVRHFYSEAGPGRDEAVDVVASTDGFIYVTGLSTALPYGLDIVTIKYDSHGNQIWLRRFDTDHHGDELPSTILLDDDGNVYVAGSGQNANGDWDFLVLKYNDAGEMIWTFRHDGPDGQNDYISCAEFDGAGDLLAAGSVNSWEDFGIIKLSTSGDMIWDMIWNGPGDTDDLVSDMCVNLKGRVTVTGISMDEDGHRDYATVQCDQNGNLIWSANYNGDANGHDMAMGVDCDNSGRVYVAGFSEFQYSNFDYFTIVYDSTGTKIWTARTDGQSSGDEYCSGLVIDSQKNCYVTGRSTNSGSENDVFTVKYDSTGRELWTDRFNGAGSWVDIAHDIKLTGDNHVIVAGYCHDNSNQDMLVIKYGSQGDRTWTAFYGNADGKDEVANAIDIDIEGNVYICGRVEATSDDNGMAVLKFDSWGDLEWVMSYGGPGRSDDIVNDLTTDVFGNVIIGGYCWATGARGDMQVIVYASDGEEKWRTQYDGPNHAFDEVVEVDTDRDGNVYVFGQSHGIEDTDDLLTIKYSPSGETLWMNRFNGPDNSYDRPIGFGVDDEGNCVVLGIVHPADYYFHSYIIIIKYNSEGSEVWRVRHDGLNHRALSVYEMTLDNLGNTVFAGYESSSSGKYTGVTVKYDRSGNLLWVAENQDFDWNGVRHNKICTDFLGNVYVAGWGWGHDCREKFVVKYDGTGDKAWHYAITEGFRNYDLVRDFFSPIDGGVLVLANRFDVLKIDAEGHAEWLYELSSGEEMNVSAQKLLPIGESRVSAVGFQGEYPHYEVLVITLDNDGTVCDEFAYPTHADVRDAAIDFMGDIHIAGHISGYGWRGIATVKVNTDFIPAQLPDKTALLQNHPNPFNHATVIRYHLSQESKVKLSLFNILGEKVDVLVDHVQSAGSHYSVWGGGQYSAGVYFYRLEAGDVVETKKLALVR